MVAESCPADYDFTHAELYIVRMPLFWPSLRINLSVSCGPWQKLFSRASTDGGFVVPIQFITTFQISAFQRELL